MYLEHAAFELRIEVRTAIGWTGVIPPAGLRIAGENVDTLMLAPAFYAGDHYEAVCQERLDTAIDTVAFFNALHQAYVTGPEVSQCFAAGAAGEIGFAVANLPDPAGLALEMIATGHVEIVDLETVGAELPSFDLTLVSAPEAWVHVPDLGGILTQPDAWFGWVAPGTVVDLALHSLDVRGFSAGLSSVVLPGFYADGALDDSGLVLSPDGLVLGALSIEAAIASVGANRVACHEFLGVDLLPPVVEVEDAKEDDDADDDNYGGAGETDGKENDDPSDSYPGDEADSEDESVSDEADAESDANDSDGVEDDDLEDSSYGDQGYYPDVDSDGKGDPDSDYYADKELPEYEYETYGYHYYASEAADIKSDEVNNV
jgi:hypothetical protein